MSESEKRFYSVREFAKAMGYSTDRVYEWVRSGYVQATRVTGKSDWLIPVSELERLQKKGTAKKTPYDIRLQKHFKELSTVAVSIASNLQRYRNNLAVFQGGSNKTGELIYGGSMYEMHTPDFGQFGELQQVDRGLAKNLLSHLKEEFPELVDITDWSDLTDDKITEDLIERLRLKAYRGGFKRGKCMGCPS